MANLIPALRTVVKGIGAKYGSELIECVALVRMDEPDKVCRSMIGYALFPTVDRAREVHKNWHTQGVGEKKEFRLKRATISPDTGISLHDYIEE